MRTGQPQPALLYSGLLHALRSVMLRAVIVPWSAHAPAAVAAAVAADGRKLWTNGRGRASSLMPVHALSHRHGLPHHLNRLIPSEQSPRTCPTLRMGIH